MSAEDVVKFLTPSICRSAGGWYHGPCTWLVLADGDGDGGGGPGIMVPGRVALGRSWGDGNGLDVAVWPSCTIQGLFQQLAENYTDFPGIEGARLSQLQGRRLVAQHGSCVFMTLHPAKMTDRLSTLEPVVAPPEWKSSALSTWAIGLTPIAPVADGNRTLVGLMWPFKGLSGPLICGGWTSVSSAEECTVLQLKQQARAGLQGCHTTGCRYLRRTRGVSEAYGTRRDLALSQPTARLPPRHPRPHENSLSRCHAARDAAATAALCCEPSRPRPTGGRCSSRRSSTGV